MVDQRYKPREFQLTGKLISGRDPSTIGENFQELKNMRYTDSHPQGIKGMTKINSTPLANAKMRNGFHFRKDQPSESHVLAQSWNAGVTTAYIYDNTTAVPSAGDFSATALLTETSGNATARWSKAPGGNMAMCDKKGAYVWGGDELRVAGFLVYNPDDTFKYDFTKVVRNTLTDASNVATLYDWTAGNDANTVLLLHFDNNVTDDSTSAHTVKNYGRSGTNRQETRWSAAQVALYADQDAGDGASAKADFGGYVTLSFDAGSAGGANDAERADINAMGDVSDELLTASIRLYHADIGTYANVDYFRMRLDFVTVRFEVLFASDGLYITPASGTPTKVGSITVEEGAWIEWSFVIDASTPATSTVDVYKNGASVASSVDCDHVPGGLSGGNIEFTQLGDTNANQTSYIDWITVGDDDTLFAFTAAGFSTTKKFGTHSVYMDNDKAKWLQVPDHADFDFSGGTFTIDGWFYFDSGTTLDYTMFYQQTDADNYIWFSVDSNSAILLEIYDTGTSIFATAFKTSDSIISKDTWYHIAVVENGDDWYIFLNGVQVAYKSDASRTANYTSDVFIGRNDSFIGGGGITSYFDGRMDEFRVSDVARWTGSFETSIAAYDSTQGTTTYVGSTRPAQGIKFYVGTANTAVSAMSVDYWDGSAWVAVSSLVDGTESPAGDSLGATGTATFTTTVSTAKTRLIEGVMAYWYRLNWTALDATTTVSQVTIDAPMQKAVDLWDGIDREILSFQTYIGAEYRDYTTNVYEAGYTVLQSLQPSDDEPITVWEESTLAKIVDQTDGVEWTAANDYLLVGFSNRVTGINFAMVPTRGNATGSVMTVSYWNGTAWVSVGAIIDGTAIKSVSLAKSGTVSWTPPSEISEFKYKKQEQFLASQVPNSAVRANVSRPSYAPDPLGILPDWVAGRTNNPTGAIALSPFSTSTEGAVESETGPALYFYKISFDADIAGATDEEIMISNVSGIPAPKTIKDYAFPVFAGGSLWLFNETNGFRNKAIKSVPGTVDNWTNEEYYFGDETEVVGGAVMYVRTGSTIREVMVVFKLNETWMLVPEADGLNKIRVSDEVGCVAPGTIKTVSVGLTDSEGVGRTVVIFQASGGIYLFDGRAPVKISEDIADVFNPDNSYSLNAAQATISEAFVDKKNQEYHWLFPSGSATTLDEEYVYDIRRNRWYEIDRGTGKELQLGIETLDADGQSYVYGGLITGYLERLENGTDFDGTDITHTLHLGDIALDGFITNETTVRGIQLVCLSTNTTTNTITTTHYKDGNTTLSETITLTPQDSGNTVAIPAKGLSKMATFHSFKFEMTTNNENVGFEPMFVGILFTDKRQRRGGS